MAPRIKNIEKSLQSRKFFAPLLCQNVVVNTTSTYSQPNYLGVSLFRNCSMRLRRSGEQRGYVLFLYTYITEFLTNNARTCQKFATGAQCAHSKRKAYETGFSLQSHESPAYRAAARPRCQTVVAGRSVPVRYRYCASLVRRRYQRPIRVYMQPYEQARNARKNLSQPIALAGHGNARQRQRSGEQEYPDRIGHSHPHGRADRLVRSIPPSGRA